MQVVQRDLLRCFDKGVVKSTADAQEFLVSPPDQNLESYSAEETRIQPGIAHLGLALVPFSDIATF